MDPWAASVRQVCSNTLGLATSAPFQESIHIMAQALGCLLYRLIYGRLPFSAEAKLQILNGDYSLPEGPSVPVVNLIRDLLQARRCADEMLSYHVSDG